MPHSSRCLLLMSVCRQRALILTATCLAVGLFQGASAACACGVASPQTDVAGGGLYYDTSTSSCKQCPAGYGCPPMSSTGTCTITDSNLQSFKCPAGTYMPNAGGAACIPCYGNTVAASAGSTSCSSCADSDAASSSFTNCIACGNSKRYYLSGATCTPKTVCNSSTQYEEVDRSREPAGWGVPATSNRVCRTLTPCNTTLRSPSAQVCVVGGARVCPDTR